MNQDYETQTNYIIKACMLLVIITGYDWHIACPNGSLITKRYIRCICVALEQWVIILLLFLDYKVTFLNKVEFYIIRSTLPDK